MNEKIFRRRSRMLRMLAMGNSLNVVVETLSKDFECSVDRIYYDHANMRDWVQAIEQNKQLTTILKARLELLNREAMALMMQATGEAAKDKFVKIGAINTALKITVEEFRIAQELGLVERKPLEVNQHLSVVTPFEADPMLRAALLSSAAKQRTEKEERTAK